MNKNSLNVSTLSEGFVLDHIQAGKSMEIYKHLKLDKLDCCVAIIKNAASKKMGKKDIIKIDSSIDINLDVLGFVSPNITVAIVRDGKICEKKHIGLPKKLTDIIKCKNPRCITSTEQDIHHIFKLTEGNNPVYRCIYCDTKA